MNYSLSTSMIKMMVSLVVATSLLSSAADALEPLKVGDNICVEGYVMDFYCINRGTLFDNPSVRTLEDPSVHSVHCLIDVNDCITSPFEILMDPPADGQLYNRGWRLDDEAKAKSVEIAQSVGDCTACNANDLMHATGFRVAMNATITNLNADDSSIPPTLSVNGMEDSTAFVAGSDNYSACLTYFGIQDIVILAAEADAKKAAEEAAAALLSSSDDSSVAVVDATELKVGDNICVEGYVMDFYCINRGTLFDNPSVRTLEGPGVHSVHCLIDVNDCITSPFEILMDPPADGQLYNRGWRLDDEAKAKSVEIAQSVGSCTACNDNDFMHATGFRVVMDATISNLNADDSDVPPTLMVNRMEDSTAFIAGSEGSACMTFFGMKDIVDVAAASSGSTGSSSLFDGITVNSNTAANADGSSSKIQRNKFQKMVLAHGSLMMIGWGLLLPCGTIIARFFKHRPNGLWFKLHRGLQVFGLLLALIAWIIALTQFNVFGNVGFTNYRHGICGMIVMVLGLLQPINAILRPHAPEDASAEKTTLRTAWEYYHKGSGWFAVLLAIPTIVLGTLSLFSPDEMKTFQIAYGVGCGSVISLLIGYIFYDKKTFIEKEEEEKEEQKKNSA